MNRGVEIAPEVADLPQSTITEQVSHGVAVRMAVLFLLLAARPADDTGETLAMTPELEDLVPEVVR
jgi:aspartate carbamoyltransferase catalytic subunit